jgi:hypothetical protein
MERGTTCLLLQAQLVKSWSSTSRDVKEFSQDRELMRFVMNGREALSVEFSRLNNMLIVGFDDGTVCDA